MPGARATRIWIAPPCPPRVAGERRLSDPDAGGCARRQHADRACPTDRCWYTVTSPDSMKIHVTEISVRYAETDRMGVAHHASYLPWFELARTGLLREAGHAYRDLEAGGVLLPVIEYACRFQRSAEYDDLLRIDTTVMELRSRTIRFRYRVFRDGERIAEAWTHHVCVTADNHPRRIPGDVYEAVIPYREPDTPGQ
jgi:acyl-CoA thioester hydrolase